MGAVKTDGFRRAGLGVAGESTGGEGANALVCKTSIRRFNSGPVLQNLSRVK